MMKVALLKGVCQVLVNYYFGHFLYLNMVVVLEEVYYHFSANLDVNAANLYSNFILLEVVINDKF